MLYEISHQCVAKKIQEHHKNNVIKKVKIVTNIGPTYQILTLIREFSGPSIIFSRIHK